MNAYDDLAPDVVRNDLPRSKETVMVPAVLSNEELVLLEDWALENGHTFGSTGRANRSAAIRALVRQLEVTDLVAVHGAESPMDEATVPNRMPSFTDKGVDSSWTHGVGIHLVCRDDLGVTDRPDGSFETRAWRVARESVVAAEYVALHQRKNDRSYRQGRLLEYWNDDQRPDRYVFLVEPKDGSLLWPGSPHGQNPVGLRR